jgi:uncharacterized protein (DUF2267 family)
MEYRDLVNAVEELEFIKDQAMAKAAIKAVLGVLTSRLEEEFAREFTESLPEPLDFETLRGRQMNVTEVSVQEYRDTIAAQFNLGHDDAWQLVRTVLHIVKDGISEEVIEDIQEALPSDWQRLLSR